MPLELISSLDNISIPALEEHLRKVRSERLIMRIKYQKVKNLNLAKMKNKTTERLQKKIEQFNRILTKLDEDIERARICLEQVTQFKNEMSFIENAIEDDEE